ncbi:Sodium/hydrogen exchanger 9B2 [Chionoecetes opilio]|uniref:Sodium/hydrogen exchanger 9B2 n=1 Tax=Chionoecetes opilio TaxID=41210 RepID=A0A8J5CZX5_CHIOP|nr:Sodium/hydrogen exchanger 9B2 [Chionoecetes opilio]
MEGGCRLLDTASTTDTSQAQLNLAFEPTAASDSEGSNDGPRHEEGGSYTLVCRLADVLAEAIESVENSRATGLESLPVVDEPAAPHHLRTDSQLSSSDASFTPASEPEVGCEDDTEGCSASPLTTHRGLEYSEAATLPLGCPSIEDKLHEWEGSPGPAEDKKAKVKAEAGWCDACCRCCLRANQRLPDQPTVAQRLKYSLTCPPHGKVGDALLWLLIGTAIWGCLIAITGSLALPGGNLFSLSVLYVAAVLSGRASAALGMPPLLGSLVAGILFESVPGINAVGHNVDVLWSSVIRNLVLVIILIRAGLGLDPQALRKLSCVVVRLAFLPCVVEAVVMALMAKLLLGLPWLWSFMLGSLPFPAPDGPVPGPHRFIVAAVSPAVVVPGLLKLAEEGYGVEAGIPTLVIAAASLDDVLAITGFSVMLGLTFAEGSLAWTLAKGPLEVVAGLVYGVVFGALCWFLPHRETRDRPAAKFVILFCLSALGMFGSHKVGLESSGPIAVLSLAFVTGLGWRRGDNKDPEVSLYYRLLWEAFQPALFVLIGAEIDQRKDLAVKRLKGVWINSWMGMRGGCWTDRRGHCRVGSVALGVCLSVRVATSFLVVMGAGFSLLERVFIAIAWLPKATVQAAIGSQALDYVRQHSNNPEDVFRGQQVVTLAVMVILVTAPIGAAAIKLTGPRFLTRHQPSDSHVTA